jgi:hypothetical protein
VVWLEPPIDEDPFTEQVRLVAAAVAATSRDEAMDAALASIRDLDEKTICMVLLLMARDFAWTETAHGRSYLERWVEQRQFGLLVQGYDDA